MSVGGITCSPSPPRRLSHILWSSASIQHSSPRPACLCSGAFKGLRPFSKDGLLADSLLNDNAQSTNGALPRRLYFQVMAESYIACPYRWWQKRVQPNMKEIHSALEFIDSVANAGNGLLVVAFYSPRCGACKALHPKVCQLAESHPEVEFILVNFDDNRSLCYGLHVRVLPYFQFYRGPQGLVCTFSCTTTTIKKLHDALGKHHTNNCY